MAWSKPRKCEVLEGNPVPSEHHEQCAFVQWFRYRFPAFSYRLFAIPNGGLRDVKIAQKLKKEGVVPGVADLFLMIPASGYHGLFIEMKRIKDGKQSRSQKKFEQECTESGYLYAICRGAIEATRLVCKYLQAEMDYDIKCKLPHGAGATKTKEFE